MDLSGYDLDYQVFNHIFFPMKQQPPMGKGILIIEALLSRSDTPHSAGLLWTSDQLVAENST